ncbi:MAG TPA: response regulator transcription factor [Thermoanaerobaculia bacterium]|jgi:DNA-binding NarL/FixJ family response regulator
MPVRILVADDHPIVLEGLAQLFSTDPELEVVVRCASGDEVLPAIRRERPDVAILDVRMPGRSGLEILREVAAKKIAVRVVLLSGQLSDAETLDAVRLGVAGIVLKEAAPRALLQCVRNVAAGEQWLDQKTIHSALDKMLRREAGVEKAARLLTRRELDIVRMVATGLRNKEIGEKLSISEGTVKMHLHSIYEKLSISGRVELSNYARDHDLV